MPPAPSPFLTLPARVEILNFLVESKLWYLFAIWAPSTSDITALRNMFRRFLWAKMVDSTGGGAHVAWHKVIQSKAHGGLGLTDPLTRTWCLHVQWILKAIGPGDYPWENFMLHRLQMCRPSPRGPRHICFLFSPSPRMVRGSPLWNSMWAAWESVKEQLVWTPPTSREQVLAMPLVHFPYPWLPPATEFLQRHGVVEQLWSNRLRAMGDCWHAEEERWYTTEELIGAGLSERIATELNSHLR